MKKNIIIFISFIIIAISIFSLKITHLKPQTNIIKVNSYLSYQEISNLKGYNLKDNTIYYLTKEDNTYNLYKVNDTKNTLVKSFTNPTDCTLKYDSIICINNETSTIYNYNLEEILSLNSVFLIAYKDTYLKIDTNSLNIYINKNAKQYRSFPEYFSTYQFIDYLKTSTNTYLLYKDNSNYILYDVNSKETENILAQNFIYYPNGFIFQNADNLIIYDLETKETKTVSYSLSSTNLITYHDNIIYVYDKNTTNLTIRDLKNETTIETNLNLKDINAIFYYANKLNLISSTKIYLIDVLNLDTTNEPSNSLDLISNLKKNYNINIKIKENAIFDYPDFTAEVMTDLETINIALTKISSIMPKFTHDFFSQFYSEDYKGLNIYLTSTLTPMDTTTQISNPAAYSFTYNNEYIMVIDINQYNIEELFCHELMHNIELNLRNSRLTPFEDWNKLNPSDFYYNKSYTKEPIFNYTLKDTLENAYFIDTYSHSYDLEDRARIFENICAYKSDTIVNKYPNILNKSLYLKDEIIKYYPSLKSTPLFIYLDNS